MKNFDDYDDYLVGKCLISHPKVKDELYKNSLVYICSQSKDEVIGFVINKKFDNVSLCDIAAQAAIRCERNERAVKQIDILKGGDKDSTKAFIIHSADYNIESTVPIDLNVSISSSISVISDIMLGKGPQKSIVVIGYSSWKYKELENELKNNDWWIVNTSEEMLFSSDEEGKWSNVMENKLGVDLERLDIHVGMA